MSLVFTSALDTVCAVLLSGKKLVDRPATIRHLRNLLRDEPCNEILVSLLFNGLEFRDFALEIKNLLEKQNKRLLARSQDHDLLLYEQSKTNP